MYFISQLRLKSKYWNESVKEMVVEAPTVLSVYEHSRTAQVRLNSQLLSMSSEQCSEAVWRPDGQTMPDNTEHLMRVMRWLAALCMTRTVQGNISYD